jgi:hypothetical protein
LRRDRERIDLLITPYQGNPAGPVAKIIANALRDLPDRDASEALVAYLHGFVARPALLPRTSSRNSSQDVLVERAKGAREAY